MEKVFAKWHVYIKELEIYKSKLLDRAPYISEDYFMENFAWVINEIQQQNNSLAEFKEIYLSKEL